MNERLRHRLGLRSSNAAQPHVNRKRIVKAIRILVAVVENIR